MDASPLLIQMEQKEKQTVAVVIVIIVLAVAGAMKTVNADATGEPAKCVSPITNQAITSADNAEK